jgi:hypothetical protein
MMTGKYLEGNGSGLILRYYPGVFLEGLRNTTKDLSQGSRSPGRDLKPGPPQYEVGLLTTGPLHSV